METDVGAEHEGVQDLSGQLSVSEDQVPPVGQQTEIGEEEEEEEDEMVSSMSVLCQPENDISVTTEEGVLSSTVSMSVSTGSQPTVSSWEGPNGAQTVQNTTGTYYTHPDSVQQEETVTTLSEHTAPAPSLGNADSSVVATGQDTTAGTGGGEECGVGGESGSGTGGGGGGGGGGGDGGMVQSEGNYESSYSYVAGTEVSQYSSYQDGYQYQYANNYSQSQSSAQETRDVNQSSAYSQAEDQSYHSAGVGSESDGHWSGQDHWGKGQGQQWQGQEQDGYWQGQEWHGYSQGQEWQGQGDHERSWQGYDGQGQQWQRQEGQGTGEEVQGQGKDGQRQGQEQHWQSQGGQGYEGQGYEGSTQEQQWQGQGSSSTGSQYDQSQYYTHSQQQYEGYQEDSRTSSTEQQYYDQSAYYGQEGYGNDGSQHQHGYSSQSNASSHVEYQQGDYTGYSHQGSHSTSSQQSGYSQESQPNEYGQYHGYDQQAYSEQAPARSSQGSSYDYGASSRHGGQAAQWSSGYQDQQSHSQPAVQNYDPHQSQYGWSKESQQHQSGDYGGQGYSEGYQHQYHSADHTQGSSNWGSNMPEDSSSYYRQYSEQPPQHHSQGGYSQDAGYHTWQEQPYQQQRYPQERQYGPQQQGGGYRPPPFHHRPPYSEHPGAYPHQGPPHGPPHGTPPPNYPPPHPSIPPPPHLPLPRPPSSRFPSQPYVHTQEFSPPPWHQRESRWQKWKHHKTSPLGRGPYSSPNAAVSSPANSVSSDVSSASYDSPTSTPAAAGSPAADSSEQVPEKSPTTPKSVFSQQLRDPRQSLSSATSVNKSYLKNAKYASATSSLVHKRNAMLKQPGWKSKAAVHSKGPPVVDPHHVASETPTKESKRKVQASEPTSFPKGSLTGFKIPKHSKASEQSKPHPTQQSKSSVWQPRPTEGGNEVRKGKGTDSEVRKPMAGEETRRGAEEDLAMTEQRMATEAPAEDVDNQPTSTVLEKAASPEAPRPSPSVKIEDAPDWSEIERKEDGKNIPPEEERKSDNSSQPADREKSHDNLISLFKSMDTSTLYALASTIQLAMTSASSQLAQLAIANKTTSTSASATVQVATQDDVPQQIMPTATEKMETDINNESTELATASCTESPITQENTAKSGVAVSDQSSLLASASDSKEKMAMLSTSGRPKLEKGVGTDSLPFSDSNPKPSSDVNRASKVMVGTPRTVIARVLSTSTGICSLPKTLAGDNGPLTVRIPIMKEKEELKTGQKEVESKGNVAQSSLSEVPNTELAQATSDRNENIAAETNKSPQQSQMPIETTTPDSRMDTAEGMSSHTQSLNDSISSAQAFTFDPKYMYKEYNLRRTRKHEQSSQSPPPPPKKPKLEHAIANETVARSNEGVVDDKDEQPPSVLKKKDGSSQPQSELNEEQIVSKKQKLEAKSSKTGSPENDKLKQLINKASIGGHISTKPTMRLSLTRARPPSSSPPPPATNEQVKASPEAKEVLEKSEDVAQEKDKQMKKLSKGQLSAGRMHQSKHGAPQSRPLLLCALCKQRGGVSSLGFLFGPYRYEPDSDSSTLELWVHEDCSVWAPGVCLVGRELKGLKEAVADGNKMSCNVCKKQGATLCCATRGCKTTYHYPCAVERGCVLNEDQFKVHCPKHKENIQAQ